MTLTTPDRQVSQTQGCLGRLLGQQSGSWVTRWGLKPEWVNPEWVLVVVLVVLVWPLDSIRADFGKILVENQLEKSGDHVPPPFDLKVP